jgi:hypothetical protein
MMFVMDANFLINSVLLEEPRIGDSKALISQLPHCALKNPPAQDVALLVQAHRGLVFCSNGMVDDGGPSHRPKGGTDPAQKTAFSVTQQKGFSLLLA